MSRETSQSESTLQALYRSLDERWRPEDVAQKIETLLDLSSVEKRTIRKASKAGRDSIYSSMSSDFHRPVDMANQLALAQTLFGKTVSFRPDDLVKIKEWISEAESSIGKKFGDNDFKHNRLPKTERLAIGVDISRRQYNKRFRLAVRMEKKLQRLAREKFKRAIAVASKSRLVANITWEDFAADLNSACFIAYYVSRCNLRSVFTNTSQARPYDEICESLLKRCIGNAGQTNWWAIAHVYPVSNVLQHLDGEQQGVLLSDYFGLMQGTAKLLREIWNSSEFNDNMIVRRGNDSTTWNLTAGAWNKLRDGWFAIMYELGLVDGIAKMCPGKVLRLMAADVAYWHQASGGDVHPDTQVWKELPRPWEVVLDQMPCPKTLVDRVCTKFGLDPSKTGWSAPKPTGHVEKFSPTPELVHGVEVASPVLASIFRKAGVFSGKAVKETISSATVDEIRLRHIVHQEQRKSEIES